MKKTRVQFVSIVLIVAVCMLLSGMIVFAVEANALPAEEAGSPELTATPWSNDPDFLVGVAAHPTVGNIISGYNSAFSGYGASDADIERQIHLASEMGSRIYRIDAGKSAIDFIEKVIILCEKYSIEVMLILGTESSSEPVLKRFKGRVKYYQIKNEMDVQTQINQLLSGTEISHYRMSTDAASSANSDKKYLDMMVNEAINIIKRVRARDPDAKILINGTWIHYGMLDYAFARFKEEGVDIDLIGWDWYSNHQVNRTAHPSLVDGLNSVAKYLYDNYGQKDIIICEYNMWIASFDRTDFRFNGIQYPGNGNGKIDPPEEENSFIVAGSYLADNIQYLYNNKEENHIKGIIIYELLDEPNQKNQFEAKMGLIHVKTLNHRLRKYQILGPKPQYYNVQKFLGGTFTPIERLNSSVAIPSYKITASVIDEDMNGTIMTSNVGGTVVGSGMYNESSVVTLTAVASPGCEFLGWYRGGIRISKNPVYQFTAVEDADNDDRDSTSGKYLYEARFTVPSSTQ